MCERSQSDAARTHITGHEHDAKHREPTQRKVLSYYV
jgi:hypothetical protein